MVKDYFSSTRSTKRLRSILTALISSQNTHKNIHFCNKLCRMILDKFLYRRYEPDNEYYYLPENENWKEVYQLCRDLMEKLSGSGAEQEDVILSLILYIAFSEALSFTVDIDLSYRQNTIHSQKQDSDDEIEPQKVEQILTHLRSLDNEKEGSVQITTIKELLPKKNYQDMEEEPAKRVDEAQRFLRILFLKDMNRRGNKATKRKRQQVWKVIRDRYKEEIRTEQFSQGHVMLLLNLARIAVREKDQEQTCYYNEILETIFSDKKYSLLAKIYAPDMKKFLQLMEETFTDTGRKTTTKEFSGPETIEAVNLF